MVTVSYRVGITGGGGRGLVKVIGNVFFNPWRNPRYPIQHGVGYEKPKKHTDELNGEARGKGRGGGKWVKGSAS